jgi:hypothetical protein
MTSAAGLRGPATAVVFIVGCDIADALVEPDGVA